MRKPTAELGTPHQIISLSFFLQRRGSHSSLLLLLGLVYKVSQTPCTAEYLG